MEIIAFLIVVLFLGLIGAIIGNYKQRLKAGFVWGALLGPIGWLIVLLGPHGVFVKCPHCGGEIPRRQDTCAHCKNKVSWSKTGDRAFRASTPVR